ncbi:MAG TPA: hypothetical protein VGD67_06370 [Pseudonocardiaceae bacterium]
MSSSRIAPAECQVHYLGSSADVAALRRSLEARGAVSRARLTPTVTAVVVDDGVPPDHPTRRAARELGIAVYGPAEAMDRLLTLQPPQPPRQTRTTPLPVASTPLITVTVLVLLGVVVLLGMTGMFTDAEPAGHSTTIQQDVP